jgi:outer membrane receptor for ferric coprogen and ferric-rhodotorulic acid
VVIVMRDGYATLSHDITVADGHTVARDVGLPTAPTLTQELTVVGRLSDYVEATAHASRTSARLIDVPQAIQVLPARFLEDIGALDTKDLYKHVSGVTDSPYSSTVVRGFTARSYTIIDAHDRQQFGAHLRLLVRVDNVLDRRYSAFSLFAARVGNVPGQPRTISVALTVSSRAGRRGAQP